MCLLVLSELTGWSIISDEKRFGASSHPSEDTLISSTWVESPDSIRNQKNEGPLEIVYPSGSRLEKHAA